MMWYGNYTALPRHCHGIAANDLGTVIIMIGQGVQRIRKRVLLLQYGFTTMCQDASTKFLWFMRCDRNRYHDPCSHVVQTGSEQGFWTGSEFGSCWRLASILLDRARSSSHRSGIVLASWRSFGLPSVRCPMWSITNHQDAVAVDHGNATLVLRCYAKVLRLYKNLFVLRCTTIFLDMSKNIVVLSGVVTVH